MSSFVCVSLFTHTGAINSSCYQQCGHSKTEQCTINMEGRPAYWLFSQTHWGRGGREQGQRRRRNKGTKFPAHTEPECFCPNVEVETLVTLKHEFIMTVPSPPNIPRTSINASFRRQESFEELIAFRPQGSESKLSSRDFYCGHFTPQKYLGGGTFWKYRKFLGGVCRHDHRWLCKHTQPGYFNSCTV